MADNKQLSDPYFLAYQDRGIKKWQTAFATEQLATNIEETTAEALKDVERLPQQPKRQIEHYLERSIQYNKVLEIQLNTLDHLGRVQDHMFGVFRGFVGENSLQIGESFILFNDLRHIVIHDFRKWSDLSDSEIYPFSKNEYESASSKNQKKIDRSFENYFNDDGWIE